MYKDFPHKGDRMRIVHNIKEVDTIEDMGRIMPSIYAYLDNRQAGHKCHMIEVECNINNISYFNRFWIYP